MVFSNNNKAKTIIYQRIKQSPAGHKRKEEVISIAEVVVQFTLRMPPELGDALARIAEQREVSQTALIVEILERYVAKAARD